MPATFNKYQNRTNTLLPKFSFACADNSILSDLLLALESAKCSSELTSNCEPKTHDCEGYENHNEDDESVPHESTPSALQAGMS